MEFEKFNYFSVDFLRYSFGRIKVISTVVESEYIADTTRQICFAYQLTGFYRIRGFTERYFLTSSSKWRVTVSGELMFLESYCICDVTYTVTIHL